MSKPVTMWAVVDSRNNICSIGDSPQSAIDMYVGAERNHYSMEFYERLGYRAVKVRVEVVE